MPISIKDMIELAGHINVKDIEARVPWVDKLLDLDMSLGVGGFIVEFDANKLGLFQLLKYDKIYRPIKYVYLDICHTFTPAAFSRHIAEEACAHVEQSLALYLAKNGVKVPRRPKPTLGKMLEYARKNLKSDSYQSIKALNELIYGRTKHDFGIEPPREQLLSLTESLLVYFVSRKIVVELLTACGAIKDVSREILRAETEKNVFIGQIF